MNPAGSDCTLIVTMAGSGERFRQAGYQAPKYELEVRGRSLFDWSQSSLRRWFDAGARAVYLTRTQDQAATFIGARCQELGIDRFDVVEISEPTNGQATTALAASSVLGDQAAPVAIYNIDTHVEADHLDPRRVRGDGWIPCFPGDGSHWSFARVDGDDRVVEVREKVRISDQATVGFYWFSSFDLYRRAYDAYYQAGDHRAGECYVAPLYEQLIAWDHDCFIERVPASAVIGLGTPAEAEAFERAGGRP